MTAARVRRTHAAAIVAVLAADLIAMSYVVGEARPAGGKRAPLALSAPTPPPTEAPAAAPPPPAPPPPPGLIANDENNSKLRSVRRAAPSKTFQQTHAAQYAAASIAGSPVTNYWALIIGINDYMGSTRDNVGSYQDARELRSYLLGVGWLDDHIMFVVNREATASNIILGIRWLASKTDDSSTVIFHYAGHENYRRTSEDGDNESRDVALWVADNKLILDGDLGRELAPIRAARMWLDFAVCRAGGFSDAGTIKPGRLVTYSSVESELSYEDPGVKHSIFGWYVIISALQSQLGDSDGNGVITVQEAFTYAYPHVLEATRNRQHPKMVDALGVPMSLIPDAT